MNTNSRSHRLAAGLLVMTVAGCAREALPRVATPGPTTSTPTPVPVPPVPLTDVDLEIDALLSQLDPQLSEADRDLATPEGDFE